jgi:hypothetical protein
MNKELTLEQWHDYYEFHIKQLFKIFLFHLNNIDKNHGSSNNITYTQFVIYLYNNSSHFKPLVSEYSSSDEEREDFDRDY